MSDFIRNREGKFALVTDAEEVEIEMLEDINCQLDKQIKLMEKAVEVLESIRRRM